jgi:hypothetical protein
MDLIGRKWMQGKGKIFASILGEIDDFIAKYAAISLAWKKK